MCTINRNYKYRLNAIKHDAKITENYCLQNTGTYQVIDKKSGKYFPEY